MLKIQISKNKAVSLAKTFRYFASSMIEACGEQPISSFVEGSEIYVGKKCSFLEAVIAEEGTVFLKTSSSGITKKCNNLSFILF